MVAFAKRWGSVVDCVLEHLESENGEIDPGLAGYASGSGDIAEFAIVS